MSDFTLRELHEWCRVPYQELEGRPGRRKGSEAGGDYHDLNRLY